MLEAEIQRHQSTQGRAAHSGHARIREHAVLLLNEGHYFLHEKFCVAIGAAAAEARRFGGCVFVDANFSDVVNSNDDERLHGAGENEIVGSVADVPVHTGNEGGGAVEEVLAIVQVESREAPLRLLVVDGGKIHNEVALVAEKAGAEFLVLVELRGAHGTIMTNRSLASTCCPGATRSLVTRPEMGA